MDEATVKAIIELAAVALPFAAAGIIWLEKRLKELKQKLGISNEQGDLIMAASKVIYAVIKAQVAKDATKAAALAKAEEILTKMQAKWEDEAGTTEELEGYLTELEAVLKAL
jgi:hypothetical protein